MASPRLVFKRFASSKAHHHQPIPSSSFPSGYLLTGIHAGVKKKPEVLDLGIILSTSNRPTSAAACFTRNAFKAAPVLISEKIIAENVGRARAVVVNSGCANAVTGAQGIQDAWAMAKETDSLLTNPASSPDLASETLVLSTGVIGQNLPISKILSAIRSQRGNDTTLAKDFGAWERAAKAFMTTDTFPKLRARTFKINGIDYRMAGMDKGAGMIHPDMGPPSLGPLHATLLGCIMTDAAISPKSLQRALTYAVDRSFNSISVDGDMSTNDTILLLANGAAAEKDGVRLEEIDEEKDRDAYEVFKKELTEFTIDLAKLVVRDGEGATKFVTVTVKGAPTYQDAHRVASRISTSALVKTALFGEDANWGRILAATGSIPLSAPLHPQKVSVTFIPSDGTAPLPVLINGEPEKVDEERASQILALEDFEILVNLGGGDEGTEVAKYWTPSVKSWSPLDFNMPVATSTIIQTPSHSDIISLKASVHSDKMYSVKESTDHDLKRSRVLDKVYNRAVRAFLNRNVVLTHELLATGFKTLQPTDPQNFSILRKWDILRITFETTMYTFPPDQQPRAIPTLHDLLSKPSHNFVKEMYDRSLRLFKQAGDGAVLPSQVLSTLVYSSLKTDAPDVGRMMIEDWLAGRGDDSLASSWMSSSSMSSAEYSSLDGYDADDSVNGDSPGASLESGDGYSKILELYCLQVLPKLEQWEYATEFLEYESELDPESRDNLKRSLQFLHSQAIASRLPSSSTPSLLSSLSPPTTHERAYSPAPSTSSSSSSLSTTSTHTVVPATPRARQPLKGMPDALEEGSVGSEGTITPRQRTGAAKRTDSSKGKGKKRTNITPRSSTPPSSTSGSAAKNAHPLNPNALTPLSLPKTHLNPSFLSSSSSQRRSTTSPSTFTLIKASIGSYVDHVTGSSSANKIASLMVVFMVVPLFSLFVSLLRRRRRFAVVGPPASSSLSSAELVRARLQAVNANASAMGVLGKMLARTWWDIMQVVFDTVKMGGSGLV
ncbi:hypothetical protein D9757_001225 [Collybiopsis confluens]|uniref:Arginine biosynthesis bifunctional protein ArgJ, mitochondrial n=1 Tax=Collybiopsis confluens TaxID=2823264 RepID=A0A8H5MGJ6_9AGAR|nr:hypothetical protein D9757_001225 [Collybiopsis confluens]